MKHLELAVPGRYSSDAEEWVYRCWREKQDRWMWGTADAPMPFVPQGVTCHAVHPDGRTIFVSVQRQHATWVEQGTFSLDAESGGEWTSHGDWVLPFTGQAFFDSQLDAWVGLDERGDICACDCVSRGAAGGRKVAKATVLREAALAYMDDGRFCVVEREGVKARRCLGDGDKCVLHVTTFGVRYGKHGDLTTTARRASRSYAVSRHDESFRAQAFFV